MFKYLYLLLVLAFSTIINCYSQTETIFVSPQGNDGQKGTANSPLKTIHEAKKRLRKSKSSNKTILLQDGYHYLDSTVYFKSSDLGSSNDAYTIKAENEGRVTVSAGKPLSLHWKPYQNGIWQASVPLEIKEIPALYTQEDRSLIRARFPNFQTDVLPYGGYSKEATSTTKVRQWTNPTGGFIHALHGGRWGGLHFEITGKSSDSTLTWLGGWQNNRPSSPHQLYRYIENIMEELDSPGEWYFQKSTHTLYYYPRALENIKSLHFIAGQLESCIHIQGSEKQNITNLRIEGIRFQHTVPTFMQTREQLLRSDWNIYRQAAIFIEHAENIVISDNTLSKLGSNALFVSGHNKNIIIKNNLIEDIGASAISFVGRPEALYNPLYNYNDTIATNDINKNRGPRTELYTTQCTAEGNLIRNIGLIEKQSAGIQIQVASSIKVFHNTIYNVPRAGINIGDGAFGGHDIAYNDVYNTVLETSDHGAFNSWGRDRFWQANRGKMNRLVEAHPEMILLDAIRPTQIHNNRFKCEHGWDIDLDDGSSNYTIYNNLCLSGGIKLREGFHRAVRNNIMINNSLHPHVWFKNSYDTIQNNIVMTSFNVIQVKDFGNQIDNNVFITQRDLKKNQALGIDFNSIAADIQFTNPSASDFTVKNIKSLLGKFENFPMDRFGVTKPQLIKLIDPVSMPKLLSLNEFNADEIINWNGFKIKNLTTLGEQSATGMHEIKGVLIVEMLSNEKQRLGLTVNDVILSYDGEQIDRMEDLLIADAKHRWKEKHKLIIWRDQNQLELKN